MTEPDFLGIGKTQLIPPQRRARPALSPKGGWRTSFVYENFYEPPFHTPTLYALRTEAWKLVEYPGFPGWTEHVHLAEDPHETENLAGLEEHAAILAALHAEVAAGYSP